MVVGSQIPTNERKEIKTLRRVGVVSRSNNQQLNDMNEKTNYTSVHVRHGYPRNMGLKLANISVTFL